MGKMIDITGQTFGKLTVIDCAGKIDGKRYYWNCKCQCGKEISVVGTSLRNGNTKSCGCGRYDGLKKYNLEQSETNKIDIGTRFGRLIVIEDIGLQEHNGHNRRQYKCQCDCGRIKNVIGNLLKQGQVSSCGQCMISKGEFEIQQLLDQYDINYQQEIVLPELYQATGRKLRFDFILYDETFTKPIRMIEFDGRQHSKGPEAIWSESDSLELIQERDNIKNKFCLDNNYPLVRIPYTKLKNITIQDILGDAYLVKGDDDCGTN